PAARRVSGSGDRVMRSRHPPSPAEAVMLAAVGAALALAFVVWVWVGWPVPYSGKAGPPSEAVSSPASWRGCRDACPILRTPGLARRRATFLDHGVSTPPSRWW